MGRQRVDPFVRYLSKVLDTGDCWLWTGTLVDGYGQFWFDGKNVVATRFLWEYLVGPIPEGHIVCHHCDTPACVNLDHLFLGTPWDNTHDMLEKKRNFWQSLTHCKWGHEFTSENTRYNKAGHRDCRACDRAYAAIRRSRRKEAA